MCPLRLRFPTLTPVPSDSTDGIGPLVSAAAGTAPAAGSRPSVSAEDQNSSVGAAHMLAPASNQADTPNSQGSWFPRLGSSLQEDLRDFPIY